MADPERYATLTDLQSILTDRADAIVGLADDLAAASGAVESYAGRVFTLAESATARVFRPTRTDRVAVDDISSTSGLVVKIGQPGAWDTTLTADSDYWLTPDNAMEHGRPFERVWTARTLVPATWPTVQVTALWGWPAVPDEVRKATLMLAARLYSRRSSPTGVAGFGDYGVVRVTASDADVARLLDPYTKPSGGW